MKYLIAIAISLSPMGLMAQTTNNALLSTPGQKSEGYQQDLQQTLDGLYGVNGGTITGVVYITSGNVVLNTGSSIQFADGTTQNTAASVQVSSANNNGITAQTSTNNAPNYVCLAGSTVTITCDGNGPTLFHGLVNFQNGTATSRNAFTILEDGQIPPGLAGNTTAKGVLWDCDADNAAFNRTAEFAYLRPSNCSKGSHSYCVVPLVGAGTMSVSPSSQGNGGDFVIVIH